MRKMWKSYKAMNVEGQIWLRFKGFINLQALLRAYQEQNFQYFRHFLSLYKLLLRKTFMMWGFTIESIKQARTKGFYNSKCIKDHLGYYNTISVLVFISRLR